MFKKFMERSLIEARIRKIIDYMKNQNLAQHLEKNISNFDDEDLQKLLNFLETWDDNLMVAFLMEKAKQFMAEVEKVKQVKSKIKTVKKECKIEFEFGFKNPIEKEMEKELENLFNF